MKEQLLLVQGETIHIEGDKKQTVEKGIQTDITYSPNSSSSNSPTRSFGNASFIERITKELFKVK